MASGVSGIPEELGDAGVLLPPGVPTAGPIITALAKTLFNWAENDSIRRRTGVAGAARARLLFREDVMIERLLRSVCSALASVECSSPSGSYVPVPLPA